MPRGCPIMGSIPARINIFKVSAILKLFGMSAFSKRIKNWMENWPQLHYLGDNWLESRILRGTKNYLGRAMTGTKN